MSVFIAQSESEIDSCFDVMSELRPALKREEFAPRVRRQQQQGYVLAGLEVDGEIVCAAGFRMLENLAWGRFLYVDDLVTAENRRSEGHGDEMLTWLIDYAKQHHRDELHLDSGVQRFGAHRFYLRRRMDITNHHFSMKLT